MKNKKILFIIPCLIFSSLFVGCSHKEEPKEIQTETKIDENELKNTLSKAINDNLKSSSNFLLNYYDNELKSSNLISKYGYSGFSGTYYVLDEEHNIESYYTSGYAYIYNKDEQLWYKCSVNEPITYQYLTDYIPQINSITSKLTIKEDEQFNSTNCYVLNASNESCSEQIDYFVTKDDFQLLGIRIIDGKEKTYVTINYDNSLKIPDAALSGEENNYYILMNKFTGMEIPNTEENY